MGRYPTIRWLVSLVLGLSVAGHVYSQQLIWLGTLGEPQSRAYDVSEDGRTVVGWSWGDVNGAIRARAFRWTAAGGMQDLGAPQNRESSEAYGVSANGNVVVGIGYTRVGASGGPIDGLPFYWTAGGMQVLPIPQGWDNCWANDVSANGDIVVGWGVNPDLYVRALRWRRGAGGAWAIQELGTLPNGSNSRARAVSADGNIVVGEANTGSNWHAFRWTAAGGMQDLGTLPGGNWSRAYGVSDNGLVVVGGARNAADQQHAFRWTAAGGMQDLGTLGGDESVAFDATGDGSQVVGWSRNANGYLRAFRWTVGGGMEDLTVTYAALLGNPRSYLAAAYAISRDGRYIVGSGNNAVTGRVEAFLLDTWVMGARGDVNGDRCVNDADLLRVLFAFGTPGSPPARHEDINKDGIVDDADLLIVLSNYGFCR